MPGSVYKTDFELTLSAGYALIVVAIAVAGEASVVDRGSAARSSGLFCTCHYLTCGTYNSSAVFWTVFLLNRRSY